MALRVVTPPAGGLVSLDQAKAHLRVDDDDDDDLIEALLLSASSMIEAETQRRYLTQTIEWVLDRWPTGPLPIAGPGDSSDLAIAGVSYADETGAAQVLDPGLYWDRPAGETRELVQRWSTQWPFLGDAAERVVLTVEVTGDADSVPPQAAAACKLLLSHLYQNRDAVVGVESRDSSTPLPMGVEYLCSPLRWS